jgi:organic radical activating enzyme
MNPRIQSLITALRKDPLPICIEKLRIALRTVAATGGEPMILRRAKAFANVLREIPIFIEEDTLTAGKWGQQAHGTGNRP